jgi:hypothetical protein
MIVHHKTVKMIRLIRMIPEGRGGEEETHQINLPWAGRRKD